MAKIKGCYVVGSTGSKDKVEWLLNQAKVDYAFNYKKLGAGSEDNSNNSISSELKDAFPNGIDLYFDNVGGRHLEAARLFKVYRTTTAIYYNSQRVEVF